jgi:opacity protein-like surface antigen
LAYGLGVEYALNPQTSVRADYTRYDFDGPEADALSLAIARKF